MSRNAKKLANIRSHSALDDATLEYYTRVERMIDMPVNGINAQREGNVMVDPEERALFIANVFTEAQGNEIQLAKDGHCSRVLEKLLKVATPFQLRVFIDAMSGQMPNVCKHQFASHVIQTSLELAGNVAVIEMNEGAVSAEDESGGKLPTAEELVLSVCDELLAVGDIADIAADMYGSHVLRQILQTLSGVPVEMAVMRSRNSVAYSGRMTAAAQQAAADESVHPDGPDASGEGSSTIDEAGVSAVKKMRGLRSTKHAVPASFRSKLLEITEGLIGGKTCDVPRIREFALHHTANPVFQVLLVALRECYPELCDELCEKLLDLSAIEGHTGPLPEDAFATGLLTDSAGSRVLEKIVQTASPSFFLRILNGIFRHRVVELAVHPMANFVLQQAFDSCNHEAQVTLLAQELLPHLEDILAINHLGVAVKLVSACARMNACQKELVKALLGCFHANHNSHHKLIVRLVLYMLAREVYEEDFKQTANTTPGAPSQPKTNLPTINYHGALILQQIWNCSAKNVEIFVQGFLAMPIDEMLALCVHPVGSRVVESFFTGPAVTVDDKSKLLKRLRGHFVSLASNKFGSHIVDRCWKAAADVKTKRLLADELLAAEHMLRDNFFGRFVLKNCHLDKYKKNTEEWMEQQKANDRKREMFSDIIGSGKPSTRDFDDNEISDKKEGEGEKEGQDSTEHEAYNVHMATLGFARGVADNSSQGKADKRAKKGKKKGKAEVNSDDEDFHEQKNAEYAMTKFDPNNEIEELFRKKRSRRDNESDDEENRASLKKRRDEQSKKSSSEPILPKPTKLSGDMASIVDAIDAAKGKKKKKKSDEENDASEKKEKKKEKKKFSGF